MTAGFRRLGLEGGCRDGEGRKSREPPQDGLMSDRLVLHRLARFANWNAEGSDDAAAGAHEIGAWSVCSDAAPAHARAFYQEKERVSQELRLRGAGSLTEI